MKGRFLARIVFVIGCILVVLIGWQQQSLAAEKSKPGSRASRPVVNPAKTGTASEVSKSGPRITFEKVVHNFGEVGPGTTHRSEFKFRNTGDDLLKISRVQTTCGCTTAKLDKKEYAPGESGAIKVTKFRVSQRRGAVSKYMYVYSNDKKKPKVTLTVKAKIVLQVECKPEKLSLSLKKENAGCPQITLSSNDNQPFAIKSFSSTADSITVDVNSSVKATKFVLEPKVDVDKLRKSLNGRINISLTHPKCNMVTILFNTPPEFKTTPPTILVFKAESQRPVRRDVWILSNYNEDFEVESVSSKSGAIKVLSQQKHEKRYKLGLRITPPAAGQNKRYFTDVLYVNIKGGAKLEIRCRGFYAKKPVEGKKGRSAPPARVRKSSG